MRKDFILMEHVSFSYGKQKILDDVNLSLEQGNSYALIGKSGSGKSTILNLIAGFLKPETGIVMINGSVLQKPRKETAFLFQELGLLPWLTVQDTLSMPLQIKGQKRGSEEVVTGLLKQLHLEEHKDKYPQELSGGERQRVALARTLIGEPDLLLMDEPSSALDAMTKEELQTLILSEHKKRSATMLIVTHDIEEALLLGQTILLLKEDGTVAKSENPFYSMDNVKEQLGFYEECIKYRRLLKL